jgi:hypothetical protein
MNPVDIVHILREKVRIIWNNNIVILSFFCVITIMVYYITLKKYAYSLLYFSKT